MVSPTEVALAVGAALIASSGVARANGRFPSAEQILVQPGAPKRIVVRSTFGVLTSTDGGHTFDWICEAAANYESGLDPGIAITGGGTVIAGVFGGVSAGHGYACTFDVALPQTFISDVTIDRQHPATAFAIGSKSSGGYFLWRSPDDATTWSEVSTLPSGFLPATVDVAPSDPSRIYASGGFFADGGSTPTLARSIDGGASWEVVAAPTSAGLSAPYIAGIDPNDAQTVWIRPDVEPGVLFVTHDAGDTWSTALTIQGSLLAFAISPDGATVLAGGPKDGLWALTPADAGAPEFKKISSVPVTCLTWPDQRVLACADEKKTGYAIGQSDDGGVTFSPLLRVACVRGPLDCPAGSGVAKLCTDAWPMIATQIKHDTCSDAGTPNASSASSGDASGSGGASASRGTGIGGTSAGGGGGASKGDSGCSCRASADPSESSVPALVLAAFFLRRNRRRARA